MGINAFTKIITALTLIAFGRLLNVKVADAWQLRQHRIIQPDCPSSPSRASSRAQTVLDMDPSPDARSAPGRYPAFGCALGASPQRGGGHPSRGAWASHALQGGIARGLRASNIPAR